MKPLTRKEFFMAKAAGQTVPDLEPITREEYFLSQISGGGGGGGGGGGIVCEGDVNAQDQSITLRMTAGELLDAFLQGNNIVIHASMETPFGVAHICYVLLSATYAGGDYKFSIAMGESITTFSANDADQYPVIYQE